MEASRQADTRANQKRRTRSAILEAAAELLREGTPPTVAEAAERALVSRATAYRYFPTQESLLYEVGDLESLVAPVEALVGNFSSDDPEQRLDELIQTFMALLFSHETMTRAAVRGYMDAWLANQREGQEIPLRTGRRVRWLQEALKPVQKHFTTTEWRHLINALSLTLGSEALMAMRDVAGVDDPDEVVANLQWAAKALLRSALEKAA